MRTDFRNVENRFELRKIREQSVEFAILHNTVRTLRTHVATHVG